MDDQNKKLLYVDGLNYSEQFGFVTRTWSLKRPLERIAAFVKAATTSGYSLKVFIDAGIESEEAIAKWKARREEEVRGEYKDVPQGLSSLVGDIFRSLGVEVFYSPLEADNDDCLAAYATADGADILSNDRDFFRYTDSTYKLFGSFSIEDGRLRLIAKEPPRPNPRFPEPAPRALIHPLPKLLTHNPAFHMVIKLGFYRRGAPSALVKQAGNPHADLVKLRASLYAKLGRTEDVVEEWPEWDTATDSVIWKRSTVTPSHDNDHFFELDTNMVVERFLSNERPVNNVESWEYSNHTFATYALLYEIYAAYFDNRSSILGLFGDYEAPVKDDSPVDQPCLNWLKEGHCKFGDKCFAKNGHHDCYDHKKGHCRRGKFCRFRHN
jgi:hypothetical protein